MEKLFSVFSVWEITFHSALEAVWLVFSKHSVWCLNTEHQCPKFGKMCLITEFKTELFGNCYPKTRI